MLVASLTIMCRLHLRRLNYSSIFTITSRPVLSKFNVCAQRVYGPTLTKICRTCNSFNEYLVWGSAVLRFLGALALRLTIVSVGITEENRACCVGFAASIKFQEGWERVASVSGGAPEVEGGAGRGSRIEVIEPPCTLWMMELLVCTLA